MKRPRFEVLKMKVRRAPYGSSHEVAKILNRKLKADQSVVYLKHNTLVNDTAYWTAIVENVDVISMLLPGGYRPFSPKFANLNLRKSATPAVKKGGQSANH